jgi:hypothetical protein
MLVNCRAFNGSVSRLFTDLCLRSCAGNTSCLTEFQTIEFPCEELIHNFLTKLYRQRLCSFLTGTFVTMTAGILNAFHGITLYIALTDNPLLDLIFQRGRSRYIRNFNIDNFEFLLTGVYRDFEKFKYLVSHKDYSILFIVIAIDSSIACGPLSNADFVYFAWDNLYKFNYRKYAITLLPSITSPLPRLTGLKYYRASSDGWKKSGNCDNCIIDHQNILRSLANCRETDADICSCNICTRQPPSLAHLVAHVLFNYILYLKRF